MITHVNRQSLLIETLLPGERTWVIDFAILLLGSIALWISARYHIPLYSVPITLQTMVVLSIAIAFGSRLAHL